VNIGSNGFTLLEALLGLAAFCLMAALLPISIQVVNRVDQTEVRLQAMEWEIFSSQVKKEIRMGQQIKVLSNSLSFKKDADSILYEKYGTKLRRRVNGVGHEVLLQNVNSVQFEKFNNRVVIKVEDTWSNGYSLTAQAFINGGN
jgi:competence protein ComGF